MCGVVGAIANRNVVPILMDGLRRLEYRGYDSAGLAVLKDVGVIERARAAGKVSNLDALLHRSAMEGNIGIAHTRWATHGEPSEKNAHPHLVNERVLLVHNGIIENYQSLKEFLITQGFSFISETDTEVIASYIAYELSQGRDFLSAVFETANVLEGAYALCIMDLQDQNRIIGVRSGPPLAVGLGKGENFLTSDPLVLQRVTDQFIYLEDGDVVELYRDHIQLYNKDRQPIERKVYKRSLQQDAVDKEGYRHFMLKEIHEQPKAIQETLQGRLHQGLVLEKTFGAKATEIFDKVQHVQIVACGTSYYAAMVAKLWLEAIANVPCQVEIASEFRYRKTLTLPNTLFICISQSGETADTLAALRSIKDKGYIGTLSICNVADSSLVRESELVFLTHAGPEIGVCSTKAFTAQLVSLFLLSMVLGRRFGLTQEQEKHYVAELVRVPVLIQAAFKTVSAIQSIAKTFANRSHALFLGRGLEFPIALEGALKLKEISYIHAEAYPAGELKHGPLALVDSKMLIVVVAPNNELLEKLKSNIQEVRARGGECIIFTPPSTNITRAPGITVIEVPEATDVIAPIVYTVSLQFLAYYVAVLKGTDVDQPRNLAKSVTVE